MQEVFLDTGFVIALESSDDQHHGEAVAYWPRFVAARPRVVTTTYVIDEIATFFNSCGHHRKAVEMVDRLQSSGLVEVVHVNEALFFAGWDYFRQHDDKRYSLTDCLSFVIMQRHGIRDALAFDKHFEQAGFQRQP